MGLSPPSPPQPPGVGEDRRGTTHLLKRASRIFPKSCLLLMLVYHTETGVPEVQQGGLESSVTLNWFLGVKNTFFRDLTKNALRGPTPRLQGNGIL